MNRTYIRQFLSKYLPDFDANELWLKKLYMKNFILAVSCNDEDKLKSYQRLEFLGDTVFHIGITYYLYNRFDNKDLGFLSKLRIQIEAGESMASMCEKIGLIECLDEDATESIKEDVFEAFIGAIYLELKFTKTMTIIKNIIEESKDFVELVTTDNNYKGLLMTKFHSLKWGNPKIKVTSENRKYIAKVKNLYGDILGQSKSKDRKIAEKIAAKNALIYLEVIDENDKLLEDVFDNEPKIEINKKTRYIPIENPNNKLLKKDYVVNLFKSYVVPYDIKTKFSQKYYTLAMTHKTYIKNKDIDKTIECEVYPKKISNERIRLLGNSVLHLILSEFIFKKFQDKLEGFMTRVRARFENTDILAGVAESINLIDYILISQSIDISHGRHNPNINASCYEAFLGALFINYGYLTTYLFVISVLEKEVNMDLIIINETNYKLLIQQYVLKRGMGNISFELIKTEGPMHKKEYFYGLLINDELVMIGVGNSVKKSHQHACKRYYEEVLVNNGLV